MCSPGRLLAYVPESVACRDAVGISRVAVTDERWRLPAGGTACLAIVPAAGVRALGDQVEVAVTRLVEGGAVALVLGAPLEA